MAVSKKAGSTSRSDDCWAKASFTKPDFTRPFAGTGHPLLFLFVAIAAITFTTVQWRLANGLANLRATGFCERARQCSIAKERAKPSAGFQLRKAKVSLNAGLAQNFLFCRAEKGLKKTEEVKRHLLCQGRRPQTLSMPSSPNDQSMSAELGLVMRRASDSPIQALKPRKWSCYSSTEHAECASSFTLFWSAAIGCGTASITHARLKTRSHLNVHP